MGGLVTLASPDSLPEGASPRTYDTDFLVGLVATRSGLTSVYSFNGASVGPNTGSAAVSVPSNAWSDPEAVYSGTSATANVTPGATPGGLQVTGYGFNIATSSAITGVQVTVVGYTNSNATLSANLILNGASLGTANPRITVPNNLGTLTFGSMSYSWDVTLTPEQINSHSFGVQLYGYCSFPLGTIYVESATITVGINASPSSFTYITTFTAQNGDVKNLSFDANGDFWVEDVTNNPGVLTLALEGITPNAYTVGVNGPDVEYLAFGNGVTGADIPRQYTMNWIDRITQVGPGAAPTFTPIAGSSNDYPIVSITQPTAHSQGSSYFLQSGGPGSTAPGNVVTVYYLDSSVASGPDADLVAAFNSGNATYIYTSFTGGPIEQGPYTVQVTSVGEGQPPGQPRQFYYFTYQVNTVAYTYYQGSGHSAYTANYQRTLATVTTSVPVSGLTVGNNVTISGTSAAGYNNSWPISQAFNSGAMVITETAVSGGVALYTYALTSGTVPTAGQLVTITNTTNANGALNFVNATIATSTGGNSGTFTINVSLPDATTAAEDGQATTAGTIFAFDPGFLTLGSSTNPIYGNATGGELIFSGENGQYIGSGTRQGVVFFITRNGYFSCPSPPVTFSIPTNTISLLVSSIPVGPPNVIARGIALTEAGQNGVPGAHFFTLPTSVQYIVENVTYNTTSLYVNDNTSTTATFTFTDPVLLNGLAIDVYGYNLFNQIELGNPAWIVSYDSRNFYGLCQNKIQNFVNLSFDGGYLPGGKLIPLGWTAPDAYGSLTVSPIFGNSYYIQNTTGSAQTSGTIGTISQSAYQDAYLVPILSANTQYSVRVTARIPSGIETGELVLTLTVGGVVQTTAGIDFSIFTTTMSTFETQFLVTEFKTVPVGLMLNVGVQNSAAGADIEVDRIEIFPTAIPVLATTVFGSYAGLSEQVDGVTGEVKFESENQQPVNGGIVLYDTFYGLKQGSMYSLQATNGLEPADWDEPEVAQKVGTASTRSFVSGEQWFVTACRNGLYLYQGGQPGKIMQEIYQVWEAINWGAAASIWVQNDVVGRRLFIGVPLPTPNYWLPDAATNAAPTTPNVILMLNYQGIDSGDDLKVMAPMHTTMFGALAVLDMRRKWSIWQIPSPYMGLCQTATGQQFYICNGSDNSKVYALDPTNTTDDGNPIDSLYTTYGFTDLAKAATMPMLGNFRKRWGYFTATIDAAQPFNVTLYPNVLLGPGAAPAGYNAWMVPSGFDAQSPALNDREASLNFVATRTYVEISGPAFNLSAITMHGKADVWNKLRGIK